MLAFGGVSGVRAQVSDYGQKQMGQVSDQPPALLNNLDMSKFK